MLQDRRMRCIMAKLFRLDELGAEEFIRRKWVRLEARASGKSAAGRVSRVKRYYSVRCKLVL
jgi:hypothetical protein